MLKDINTDTTLIRPMAKGVYLKPEMCSLKVPAQIGKTQLKLRT